MNIRMECNSLDGALEPLLGQFRFHSDRTDRRREVYADRLRDEFNGLLQNEFRESATAWLRIPGRPSPL